MDLATQSAEAMQSMERHPARARGRVAEIRSDADEPSKALRTQSVAHFHLGSARDCALVNRFQVTPLNANRAVGWIWAPFTWRDYL